MAPFLQLVAYALCSEQRKAATLAKRDDTDPAKLYPGHNFSVPIDHFHNETKYEPHVNDTFPLAYWFDATYYKPGGPVIILQGGETAGSDRLPYLQKGIVYQLSKATNGIGVILEHRYYGTSFPTPDLSTKNLRFLTTQQALADEAYFAQNIKFPGLEKYGDLTSKTTAWISYGGSYAGAFSAFLRVQYPDVFWGAISSSGVTKAIYDYWAYFRTIAEKGPPDCIKTQQTLIHAMDNIWLKKNHTTLPQQLKTTFGFGNLTRDQDFAFLLENNGIGDWQSLNWDPAVTSDEVYRYCDNITSDKVLYPATEKKRANVTHLLNEGGYRANKTLENRMLNMIGYYNLTQLSGCDGTLDSCFGQNNQTYYDLDSIADGDWRSWPYQYCTEWGYLQTGNTPPNVLPLISRTLDLEYQSHICRAAFNITTPPDVEIVNKYGAYDISYPRLAFVDGDWDPWKDATPHAFEFGAPHRNSTASEPFILIDSAVHHWDENGLWPNETTSKLPPLAVRDAQSLEQFAVEEWLQEWKLHCLQNGGCS
ncbi:hypothetical protein M409DRAFT_63086 [Zasmidium cellare ATCC 36951]|uniref:Peptidase S28 n=1 Tax=Zasmidium cellare ATCC 36951 TaxID=1080233 RepID=A0A6A6D3Z8_ZASCE|nr:uncharacterized protein M409DRAFT_63086 [Zasmidium cellare ATCC 36951]KAF2172376.1 hypothetical protein M409DRAFT_63086 [Zasmidium cellare ATCC 36951]